MWFLLSLYYLNLFLFKVWSLPSPMWWFSFQIHNQEQHLNGNFILDPMVFLRPYIMMKTMKFQPFMILMKRLVNVSSYISCPSLFEMHEIYIQFSPHMHSANCRNPRSPPLPPISRSNRFPGKIRSEYMGGKCRVSIVR